jgi:hypothetical protein
MTRIRKTSWLTSAAVAALISAAPAQASENPAEIVEGWIAQGEAFEWLRVSHGGVTHDAATGVTTVADLVMAIEISDLPGVQEESLAPDSVDISYLFTFPSLVFENLEVDGDYYRASAIRAEILQLDFEVDTAEQGRAISSGVYEDIAASNIRWARLPEIDDDPARPISRFYPLAAALVDISFDEVSFGSLALVTESDEQAATTTIHYGPGRIDRTERGNVSAMSFGAITVTGEPIEGAEEEEAAFAAFEMSIEAAEAEDYNYGDMVRLFDPDLEPGSGEASFETMIGWMSARNWTVSADDVTFTMADLRMEDVGGRRPTLPLLSRLDELYLTAVNEDAEPDQVEVVELVAAFYGAFRLGLMEMRGLAATGEGFSGSLDVAGIAGLSADGIESIHYRGLEANDGGEMQVHLGDFTISDVGFPSLAALIAFEKAQEEGDIDTMLAAIPTLGGIFLSDLLVHVPFLAELSLAGATFEMSDHIGPIPTRIDSTVENLRMPTWMLDDESFEIFDGLGYEEVNASQKLNLTWREEDETLSLSSSAALEEGAALFLDARLGGLSRDVFVNPMNAPFLAFAMTLNEASLRFVDNSLTERALTMFGEQQGTDARTIRAQALGILPFALAALQRPEFLMSATAAASSFLEKPGTLRIDMRPAEPVPLAELLEASETDPGLMIDLLNVEIVAE